MNPGLYGRILDVTTQVTGVCRKLGSPCQHASKCHRAHRWRGDLILTGHLGRPEVSPERLQQAIERAGYHT